VKCNICGSLLYAKARQAGKTIRCNDCHSDIKVPKPPKVKQKVKIDVDNAKTFSFEESAVPQKKREDPYRKSARELLDEAEKSEDETPGDYRDPDIPSMREWAMNVFGIFLDIGVIAHWLGLSLLGAIPAAIVLSIGHPFLIAMSAAFALVFVTLTIACGFAIMQSVANKHESVENWPEADPSAWFDDLVVAVSAVALAAAPMLTLTSFAFSPGLTSTAMTMMSIYLLFPFFVLSMMDMQSIFMPFSPEVARSVTRCQEAWGALYLSSGLLFFGLFLFFVMISAASPGPAAAIAVVATIAVTFSYFSMIGRLAFAIGQPVNDPAKNSKKTPADGEQKTEPN
jgi:DNA-directed RNA polymerase subunit M/transcription elongation factor TFIIS